MNAPIFRADKLKMFLEHKDNDGSLIGYGTDFLYHHCIGKGHKDKFAVIHSIECRNPKDEERKDGREINKIANQATRVSQWKSYQDKYMISVFAPTVHMAIR
eukprot:gene19603-26286_t